MLLLTIRLLGSTPSGIPDLVLPPVEIGTPTAKIATPSGEATPSPIPVLEEIPEPPQSEEETIEEQIEEEIQEQVQDIPNPVARGITIGALRLLSRLAPGTYYRDFRLPLPANIFLLALAAGLVSTGLLLIRL